MRRLWMMCLLAFAALTGFNPVASGPEVLEVAVFLEVQATEEQRRAVRKALRASPSTLGLVFVSHEQAHQEFLQMLNGADVPVEPGDLPESFRLIVPDVFAFEAVYTAVRQMPGVHTVVCRPGAAHNP